MPLDGDSQEAARRIRAARELAGITQAELGRRLEEYGLGLHDAGKIERGKMALQKKHRDGLAEALGMPPAWFTLPRHELLQGIRDALSGDDYAARLAAVEGQLKRLATERGGQAPPGELGRRAEGSRPSVEHPRQSESQSEEDRRQGDGG